MDTHIRKMVWLLNNDQYGKKWCFHPPWQGFAVPHLEPVNGLLGTQSSKTQDVLVDEFSYKEEYGEVFVKEVTNSTYISHIQHSLRLLLEEQMSDKDHFNIIAFGSDIVPWQQELLPSQPENLEKAWRWVLSLECKGSRNLMSALRRAVEVDFKDKDKYKSQGLYLLTTGIPDQDTHTISAYVAEACGGFDLQLHVCLFSVTKGTDPSGIIPARYANPMETATAFKEIVEAARGRFH